MEKHEVGTSTLHTSTSTSSITQVMLNHEPIGAFPRHSGFTNIVSQISDSSDEDNGRLAKSNVQK